MTAAPEPEAPEAQDPAELDAPADMELADGDAPWPDDGVKRSVGPVVEEDEEAHLVLNIDGFEGPLDVLLALARDQKVDLKKISILQLVEQYLEFVDAAKARRLELAADYLVMAAWLAYLKSRLLLPEPEAESDEPSGEEMAARLAFQLQRLEAMREAGAKLLELPQLNRDVFGRGAPGGVRVIRLTQWTASIYDLLSAYSQQRVRGIDPTLHIKPMPTFAIEEARMRLERIVGRIPEWSDLRFYLPRDAEPDTPRASILASTLNATLELAKEGRLEVRQAEAFGPVYIRSVQPESEGPK